MRSEKRNTAYRHKARRGKKKEETLEDFDERLSELEMQQAGIDTQRIKNRLDLMTAEQMAETQQIAAQNALKLFNELLEDVRRRIPAMDDEKITNTLLAIWDKTGGSK